MQWNRNYSVLELAECQQQYSGQKNDIFQTVWPGASPAQNNATAIKTRSLSSAYCGQLDWLVRSIIDLLKNTDPAEHFDI